MRGIRRIDGFMTRWTGGFRFERESSETGGSLLLALGDVAYMLVWVRR